MKIRVENDVVKLLGIHFSGDWGKAGPAGQNNGRAGKKWKLWGFARQSF